MIPLLDKTVIKFGLILALVGAILAFYKWHYTQTFNAGADSVRAELMEHYEKREKELNSKLKDALDKNKAEKEKASRIQNDLRNAQKINMRLRDEIHNSKKNFNCDALGNEFFELWNKTIGKEPKYD